MKAIPTDDPLFGKGSIRRDGRKLHPMYLFDVKTEAESNGPWDAFKLVRMISAEDLLRSARTPTGFQRECSLQRIPRCFTDQHFDTRGSALLLSRC